MENLASFFLKNYKFTIVLSAAALIYGLIGLFGLKSETFPTVNIGAVIVTTRYDGATAQDIETKITKPVEEEIQKISGLKKVRSTSQAGVSTIVTDVDIDRYEVEKVISDLQRAVDRAQLPPDLKSKPLFIEIKSEEFPVVELAVIGSNEGRKRDAVVDLLKEDLLDNKKISSVNLAGFRERQFNILLSQKSLLESHVSINEVERALISRNVTIPGGELKNELSQKLLRIEGKAADSEEIGNIVIRSNYSGNKVLLRDVARIEDGESDPETLAGYLQKDATHLTIAKKGGADMLEMEREIVALLDQYSERYKGELEFKIFNNEALRVSERLGVLTSNGWQGLLLVIVVMMIFIKGKIGLMASLSLPLSLMLTLGLILSIGYTLNTITIIGLIIALGMLVDNAAVIAENFVRLRKEGYETDDALLTTIRDLWVPVTATVLTTVAAFLPMLVTTGVMGQFIKAIPIVLTFSLLICLFEGFFLLPTRLKLVGLHISKDNSESTKDWFDRLVLPAFEKQILWLVLNKYKAALGFTAIFAGSILLLATGVRVNLFPDDQTEIFLARFEVVKGTRLEKTHEIAKQLAEKIQAKMGSNVLHAVSTVGASSVDPSDPKGQVGSNTGLIRIYVSKEAQYGIPTQIFLTQLREIKDERIERLTFEALANGPPVGEPVAVTFRSNNEQQLAEVAKKIVEKLKATPGVFDARADDVFGDDEVLVRVDYERAARLGLSLEAIGSTIRTAVAGQKTGDINLNNREVDYSLRFQDVDRNSVEQLKGLKIADNAGNLIGLGSIAQFNLQQGSPQVKRYDFRRAKTVLANIDPNIINSPKANSIVAKEFEGLSKEFKEVTIVFGGEQEDTNESFASLLQALILSLVGIFALMVLVFGSFSSPFIILTTIPLGLVGVSAAFFVQQKDLSFMAFIGIIGVGGVIVNAGIILISFIEQMKQESKRSLAEILVASTALRLRSVLVTTITTAVGLVPTAYGIGGTDYFIIPMALAILWGLAGGTILTLYWIPPAYAIVASLKDKTQSMFVKK